MPKINRKEKVIGEHATMTRSMRCFTALDDSEKELDTPPF